MNDFNVQRWVADYDAVQEARHELDHTIPAPLATVEHVRETLEHEGVIPEWVREVYRTHRGAANQLATKLRVSRSLICMLLSGERSATGTKGAWTVHQIINHAHELRGGGTIEPACGLVLYVRGVQMGLVSRRVVAELLRTTHFPESEIERHINMLRDGAIDRICEDETLQWEIRRPKV